MRVHCGFQIFNLFDNAVVAILEIGQYIVIRCCSGRSYGVWCLLTNYELVRRIDRNCRGLLHIESNRIFYNGIFRCKIPKADGSLNSSAFAKGYAKLAGYCGSLEQESVNRTKRVSGQFAPPFISRIRFIVFQFFNCALLVVKVAFDHCRAVSACCRNLKLKRFPGNDNRLVGDI